MNISNLTFPPEFNSTRETLYLNESKSTGYITDIGNGNLIALIGNGCFAAKIEPHDGIIQKRPLKLGPLV